MAIFDRFFKGRKRGQNEREARRPEQPVAPTAVPGSGPVAPAPAANPPVPANAPEAIPGGTAAVEPEPEVLCGIEPGMSQEEIRDLLAMLFRRHNRLASSLDGAARDEADHMLDVIVRMREKYLD